MNSSCLVFAPSRFSNMSFLRLLALALCPISLCLMPLPAHAGTWNFAVTSWTYSRTLNGVTYGTLEPRNYSSEIGVGGGSNNFSTTAQADEDLTVTATWHADPNIANDKAPPSTILKIQTSASANGNVNGSTAAGTDANDGFGDPIDAYGTSKGIHYRVEVGGTFQYSLKLHASYTNPSGAAIAAVGGISFSIVNGTWAGPYYFHHGQYTTGGFGDITTPWASNTASSIPTIEDSPDDTSLFILSNPNYPNSRTEGDITPVWYWTGPNLGVSPPPFRIHLEAEAYSIDSANTYDSGIADDGLGDPDISIPGGARCSGSASAAVTIQSDVYAPGEGNGYWALGPTIHLKSIMNAPLNEDAPYSVDTAVSLSASIEDGLNN